MSHFYDPIDNDTDRYTESLSDVDDYEEPVYYCKNCDDAVGADSCLYLDGNPFCSTDCRDDWSENYI